jgi:hypothetical protein
MTTVSSLPRAVFRLHRTALIVCALAATATSAAFLWAYGPGGSAAHAEWQRMCGNTDACEWGDAISRYHQVFTLGETAVSWLPFLVAAWAGTALIGRELEIGTAQLAWTQGVSPTRWLATKLAVPAALLITGATVLVLLNRVVFQTHQVPFRWSWYNTDTFHAHGTTGIVWPLLGLAVGALAGLVLRRTLPALAVAVLSLAVLSLAVGLVRPHLWPWVTSVSSLEEGFQSPWNVIYGNEGAVTSSGAHIATPMCRGDARCLADHDAVGYFREYHPTSHFWPLQLMETGLVLALAATAAATAFWLLRRRTR